MWHLPYFTHISQYVSRFYPFRKYCSFSFQIGSPCWWPQVTKQETCLAILWQTQHDDVTTHDKRWRPMRSLRKWRKWWMEITWCHGGNCGRISVITRHSSGSDRSDRNHLLPQGGRFQVSTLVWVSPGGESDTVKPWYKDHLWERAKGSL